MHVAVTGASTGIGEAIARELASAGASVTLVARRRARLEQLAGELPRAHVVTRDLADLTQAADWIDEAERALGPIDVLINNAGVQIIGATADGDVEDGERLLRLNVFTPLRLVRALLPAMLARRSGVLVNVASMAALAPTPGMTYYNASKAGIAAASEALRGELRGSGVHVVTVYPGIILTDMGEKGLQKYESSLALRLQPKGDARALARRIRDAIERRRPRVIYPRMNALARWFPGTTRLVMDALTPPLRT
ncbi:MAG: SDR family NAD(P)-dependent oxidoreductase [Myxococcales bacterium]|nr:SDR family NAD(P)-dependent oxidoreductase [Myxococcales bacterium]